MYLRKFVTLFLCFIAVNVGRAQSVNVEINSGIYNAALKQSIEKNASALLTEINRANRSGAKSVNFSGISITSDAQKSIAMLWDSSPFYCEDRTIVESVTTRYNGGYQIRNIPLEFTPAAHMPEDETNQEAIIDFDKFGKIESFNLAINNNQYIKIFEEGNKLGDFNRRQIILNLIEQFRTAYNQKDTIFLDKVFSDDALIITGKVIKTKKSDYNIIPQNKVIKVTQSKQQYLTRLKVVFNTNRYINVNFDSIEIFRHPTKTDYYGVSLKQDYKSSNYPGDVGYLFLLWDFSKGDDRPQIHVRVWEEINNFIGRKKFSIQDVKL